MAISSCKRCDTPLAFGKFIMWTGGGTIAAEKAPDLRLFFIEVDELLNLLSYLSELLGVPIDNILIQSERAIGQELVAMSLPGALTRFTRSTPDIFHRLFFAKLAVKHMAGYARAMGYGSVTIIEYEGKRRSLVRVRNPHCLPLIIGDCVGAFQEVLGVNTAVTWKKENGTTLIEFRQTDEKPYQVPINRADFMPGEVDFKRCPACGVPLSVSDNFEWDMLNGIITNRRSAYREVFLSVEGINAIFAEMEKELGDEVPLMVAQRQAELMRERMSKRNLEEEGGIWGLFEELKLRGMGNPVEVEEAGKQLKVKVENPFNDALVAGRIAGYYEAVEKIKSRVTWVSSDEGYLVIGIEPQREG
jgi:hypothetical protein